MPQRRGGQPIPSWWRAARQEYARAARYPRIFDTILRFRLYVIDVGTPPSGQPPDVVCEAVLIALARTDGQLFHRHIDVLDPESGGCHHTQAAPLEQFGDRLGGAFHDVEVGS